MAEANFELVERTTFTVGARDPLKAWTIVGILLAVAALATLLGADLARNPTDARELAERTLQDAIAQGSDEPSVQARLVEMRRAISRRPLDSKTRVTYASVLLGLSRRLEDLDAAAFHARRAAELAPVTLPVVRPAVLVLAHSGYPEEALALIREIFDYDAESAAELLALVEVRVLPEDIDKGLPDTPSAWLAWAVDMERRGRQSEAGERLAATSRRWPDHASTMEHRAVLAVRNQNWEVLREMFPPDREIPEESAYAVSLLCRARIRAEDGDLAGASADIRHALAVGPLTGRFQIHAGAALDAVGEHTKAREYWNRALFSMPSTESYVASRAYLSLRLALWEDQHGTPAAALRHWEALLELRPEHTEARRRVDDLSGFRRRSGGGR